MRCVHGVVPHRVVVVAPATVVVTAVRIQRLPRRAVGLHIAIDRITIQRPGHSLVIAQRPAKTAGEMHRDDVVVVIIRQPAMTTIVVELANFIRHASRVVGRIENRHAIGRERDGPPLEIVRGRARGENERGRSRWRRHQRQPPIVRLPIAERSRRPLRIRRVRKVRHRQRDLLLPGGDARHPVRHPVWQVVRLFVERGAVPVEAHLRLERCKRSRHESTIASWRHIRRYLSHRRHAQQRGDAHLRTGGDAHRVSQGR